MDECAGTYRRDRAADPCPLGDVQRCEPGKAAAGRAGRHPARVPAGQGPRHPLQGVPPPQTEDTGLPLAGGRPLPHSPDPHAGSDPGGPDHCPGAAAQRGPDRGHRPGTRPGPHAVWPCGRSCPEQALPRWLQALYAEPAGGGQAGKRGPGLEPDLGGAERHCDPHQGYLGGHAGGRIRSRSSTTISRTPSGPVCWTRTSCPRSARRCWAIPNPNASPP